MTIYYFFAEYRSYEALLRGTSSQERYPQPSLQDLRNFSSGNRSIHYSFVISPYFAQQSTHDTLFFLAEINVILKRKQL